MTKSQGRRVPKLLGTVAVIFRERAKSRRKTLESQKNRDPLPPVRLKTAFQFQDFATWETTAGLGLMTKSNNTVTNFSCQFARKSKKGIDCFRFPARRTGTKN
jgi:hypothetical protein